MSDVTATPRVHGPGQGVNTRFFADEIVVKERRPELDIFEAVLHAGCEPPLHVHQREHEWIYVIHGAITAFVEGEEIAMAQGSVGFLPRGIAHTYAVDTGEARVYTVNSPGGFAGLFADLATAYGGEMPAAPGPDAGDWMGPVFDAYGIVNVGPNPRYA